VDVQPLEVAPDGSPVEVFRHLPAGNAVSYITSAITPGASILDLGCGAGRLLRPLARLGHPIVGVDLCATMLEQITEPTVCADIIGLDLGRTFDAVVLASYLVNDPSGKDAYLTTCRRHIDTGGVVIVQRYDPLWLRDGFSDETSAGDVTVSVEFSRTGPDFAFVVRYGMGSRSWMQTGATGCGSTAGSTSTEPGPGL
jgi:SAM-dependent methyltransferase